MSAPLSPATRKALAGASAAVSVGVALGGTARLAHASSGVERSAPVRLAVTVADAARRLDPRTASLLVAALVVAVAAAFGARALVRWVRARRPAVTARIPSALATSRRRRTPAAPIHALADRGYGRAEIARRTGLAQDAVLLAMYLK